MAGLYKTKNNSHIPYEKEINIIGNITFKSINATNNITQSRRDDLESLLFCLIYFYNGGDLPWNKETIDGMFNRINKKALNHCSSNNNNKLEIISRNKIIYELKKRISPKTLCYGMPSEFEIILYYIMNLNFTEEPNYELIKDLLKRVINNNSFNSEEGDFKFIWEKKIFEIYNEYKINGKKATIDLKTGLFKNYDIVLKNYVKSLKRNNRINFKSSI